MPASGANFSIDDVCGYQDVNEIKNSYCSGSAPSSPANGMSWWDSTNELFKIRYGGAWPVMTSAAGCARDGMIVAWVGGYFGDGSNGSYTRVLGSANTVAGANAYLNSLGWWVCDGAAVNEAASAIWNAASRYLPNLTDDRFIMGDTAAAALGGSSTRAHTHAIDFPSTGSTQTGTTVLVDHGGDAFSKLDHTHNLDIASFNSGGAINASTRAAEEENRPVFLGCFYIVKVK